MSLKQAKKQVGLKASVADNIGIPKFPTTTIAAQISKPISEAIDVFRKKAEANIYFLSQRKVSSEKKSRLIKNIRLLIIKYNNVVYLLLYAV